MTILRKRIIFQHKDYPRGKTLPNLYAKRQFRVLVSLIYQNTRRVRGIDRAEIGFTRSWILENFISVCYLPLNFGLGEFFMPKDKIK